MAAQKKLLYISWVVPPAPGGSSYITHQLATLFDSNEMVIAGGSKKPFQSPRQYDGVLYNYFYTELSLWGHGNRYFAIFRWVLFPVFFLNLWNLTRKERPDAILATFPDGYYLLASWLLSRFYKIELYTYFHNTYVENRTGISKWFASKIQQNAFRDSKIIFLMSEGMINYYKKKYPEFIVKFEVLSHTFNKYPAIVNSEKKVTPPEPYKLVMIGTFNNSNIEATIRLLTLIAKFPNSYQVEIYTSVNKQLLKYKWGLDLDLLKIKHCGFVKQEEVNQVISNYDACLLTHGFTGEYTEIEYQTIFPTRMIPLLLSGKPILVHSPENSFLNQFIRQYDCGELVSEKSDIKIIEALKKVTQNPVRIEQLLKNATIASRYFYGPEVFKSLIFKLNR